MGMRRAAAAALVLGLATALAGCSAHPGQAAVVDGHEISQAYVDRAVDDVEPLFHATPAEVLGVLVVLPAWRATGEAHGVTTTAQEARDFLSRQAEASGVPGRTFGPGAVDVAEYLLISSRLPEAADQEQALADLTAALEAQDVRISPRYGEWSADGTVVPVTPSWVVEPADDAAQEPVAP